MPPPEAWALRKSLSRELALAALQHALTCRRPPAGLVHHTDRGSQYASQEYRTLLDLHGVRCSMSAAVTATTTPSPRVFSRRSRKNSCTAAHSRRDQKRTTPSATTSRTTTTRSGAILPPGTNHPSTLSWPIRGRLAA